ncbi:hypothetical protein EJA72_05770 [Pseudomonas sp. PB120]|nr:hypothetical protein [Pseudomonas sp. PB120]
MWRGSLLPLGCVAAPFVSAAHSSASKLARHRFVAGSCIPSSPALMRGFLLPVIRANPRLLFQYRRQNHTSHNPTAPRVRLRGASTSLSSPRPQWCDC